MSLPDAYAYSSSYGSSHDIRPYILGPLVAELGEGCCGLDVGCSCFKLLPTSIGIETRRGDQALLAQGPSEWCGPREHVNIVGDGTDLRWFADGQFDYVFSGHMLEHVPYERALAAVGEFMRVLRPGGLLFLYLPDGRVSEDDFHAGKEDLQELTDSQIERVDEIGSAKEQEVLEI